MIAVFWDREGVLMANMAELTGIQKLILNMI
jgi:hypothetical protein